jgi:hypothetical protein
MSDMPQPVPVPLPLPLLDADALRAFPPPRVAQGCPVCGTLRCAGWESIGAPLAPPQVRPVGSLRDPADETPTLEEHHLAGTSFWSPQAPIAPRHFPYNLCEVVACTGCGRGFVQYTEHGGYYVDHRVREIDPERVVEA